ncbi:MAG: DUF6011 domain-containing protein [Propionibacteriaceae bacterium]|jgi:hypothetical protein|nr:DUF6011 domain-containing protein [Propionibacteriaceae bacterium]
MTSTFERRLVFLDASVLAAPTTRSLFLFGQLHEDADFRACWSAEAEAEADQALMRRAGKMGEKLGHTVKPVLVSDLRREVAWGDDVVVPPAPDVAASLVDTHFDDRHILAAAAAASSRVVVTVDVDDFGRADLERLGVSAGNPDLFLAHTMTEAMYRFTLERLSGKRTLEPKTPESIHASLGRAHPMLAMAMRKVYPSIKPLSSVGGTPVEVFRGSRCLVCGKKLTDPESLVLGVGPECRRKR